MSSYSLYVINLYAHVPKLQQLRVMRLISISLNLMSMMITYNLLLHHLLINLNHLVHTCLNMLLIPFHPPEGHARLLLSIAYLLGFLLHSWHLFTILGMNTVCLINLVMFMVMIVIQSNSLRISRETKLLHLLT